MTSGDGAGWGNVAALQGGGGGGTPPLWKGTREEGNRKEGQPCELIESAVWLKKGH